MKILMEEAKKLQALVPQNTYDGKYPGGILLPLICVTKKPKLKWCEIKWVWNKRNTPCFYVVHFTKKNEKSHFTHVILKDISS